MIRHLKKSASASLRMAILEFLSFYYDQEFSAKQLAGTFGQHPCRMSVILYELANQGHIARRRIGQVKGPGTISYFKHIPGHAFEVYQSKSKPRPKQKRKAKAERPLLDKVWRDKEELR